MIRFRNASATYNHGIVLTPMMKKDEMYAYVGRNAVQVRDHGFRPVDFGGEITLTSTSSGGLQGERQKWYAERNQTGTLYIQYQGSLANVRLIEARAAGVPVHSPLSSGDDWIQRMVLMFRQESV